MIFEITLFPVKILGLFLFTLILGSSLFAVGWGMEWHFCAAMGAIFLCFSLNYAVLKMCDGESPF